MPVCTRLGPVWYTVFPESSPTSSHSASLNRRVKPGEASPRQAADFPFPEKEGDNCWCSWCRWNRKSCVISVDDIDLPKAAMLPWGCRRLSGGQLDGLYLCPRRNGKNPLAALTGSGWNHWAVHPCSLLKAPFVLPPRMGSPKCTTSSHTAWLRRNIGSCRGHASTRLPNRNFGIAN